MVGMLIATHGGFAEGLLSAVELLAGKPEKVKTIGLYHGDDIGEFEKRLFAMADELDDGDGVMAFVDILGGSPSNVVMRAIASGRNIKAIAGVNMGMMVQAVMMRESCSLEELCRTCYEAGCMPPVLLHEKCKEMLGTDDEDDSEDF